MQKITIYVALTTLYTSLIIIFALFSVFFIFTYISESSDIGQGNYSAISALFFVLYESPSNLYLIMPVCGLLGSLMGLGMLVSNSELIVMRSVGLSIFQISKGVILTAVFLAVITFFLGAYISPLLHQKAIIKKTLEKGSKNALVIYDTQSIWIKDDDGFTYIGHNNTKGNLSDITKYRFSGNQLEEVQYGSEAHYYNNSWKVNNVKTLKINRKNIDIIFDQEQIWNQLFTPSLLKTMTSNIEYLNLNQLFDYIKANKEPQQSSDRIWLKFWQIIFQPFSLIILMLVAVPFSLGTTRSNALGYKIIIGIFTGFLFYIINQIFTPFSLVYGLSPFAGAALPSIIFTIVLTILFWIMKE